MSRLLRRLPALAVLLLCVVIPAAAQASGPSPWVAAYQFVAPAQMLGADAKSGPVALTLTNTLPQDARDVVVSVEPSARVGLGPFNREQAGTIASGSAAVLHVQLLLSAAAKDFPLTVSWKTADGADHSARVTAFDVQEVAK